MILSVDRRCKANSQAINVHSILNSPTRAVSLPVTPITRKIAETSIPTEIYASRIIIGESTPSIMSRIAKELTALYGFFSWTACLIPFESSTCWMNRYEYHVKNEIRGQQEHYYNNTELPHLQWRTQVSPRHQNQGWDKLTGRLRKEEYHILSQTQIPLEVDETLWFLCPRRKISQVSLMAQILKKCWITDIN